MSIDDIDRKILSSLQDDGRASSAELASRAGVSVSTAHERVRKLTQNGVIETFSARLDPRKVGARLCAFVLLDVGVSEESGTISKLCDMPEVMELHHITGEHSYLVKIRVADTTALNALLHDKIKPLPGVRGTHSLIALETCKETGSVLLG